MTTTKSRNFLRRALDGFVEARQRQAQFYIDRTLLSLDDDALHRLGYDREMLARRGPHWL